MDEQKRAFHAKLTDLKEKALEETNCVEKERRCSPIESYPELLRALWTQLNLATGKNLIETHYQAGSFWVTRNCMFNEKHVTNYIMAGIYETLDTLGVERLLRVKVSNKVKTDQCQGSYSVREWWISVLRRNPDDQKVLTALDVALRERDFTRAAILSIKDGLEWDFYRDIIILVRKSEGSPLSLDDVDSFRAKFPRTRQLALKVKRYFNRGDIRAYYQDSNVWRQLSGAIVQRLFQPSDKKTRHRLPSSQYIPVYGKNMIKEKFSILGNRSMFMFGDISSFTASNHNSWIMVTYVISLIGESGQLKHLNAPFIVTIDGYPLEITLLQTFCLYLYEVVFATAHYEGEEFYTTGGYLGVNGNMAITCVAFSIVMEHFYHISWNTHVAFKAQIGGDDWKIQLLGEHDRIIMLMYLFTYLITRYVGLIKEPKQFSPNDYSEGVHMLNYSFCKKPLRLTITMINRAIPLLDVLLENVPGLPVMEQLLIPMPQNDKLQQKFTQEYLSGVIDVSKQLVDPTGCITYMRELFEKIHKVHITEYMYLNDHGWSLDARFQTVEQCQISNEALRMCDLVLPIIDSTGFAYRSDLKSVAEYLCSRKKLKREWDTVTRANIYMTNREHQRWLLKYKFNYLQMVPRLEIQDDDETYLLLTNIRELVKTLK